MKLRSSLPYPPGFLYAIPLLNLFAILLMCYVIAPYFEKKTGITVQMPSSNFELARVPEAAVITMTDGGSSRLYLNQTAVTMNELERKLESMDEYKIGHGRSIVIMADRMVDSASLREVAELCARKGYRVVLAGGIDRNSHATDE